MPVLEFAIPILLLVLFAVAIGAAFNAVLSPIDRLARASRRPTQFTLADLLSLFCMVQAALALSLSVDQEIRLVMAILGLLVPSLVWFISVRTLSGAGVATLWHRVVFVLLIVPGTLFGVVFVFILPVIAIGNATESDSPALLSLLFLAVEVVTIAGLYGLRRLTKWIVERAKAAGQDQAGVVDEATSGADVEK